MNTQFELIELVFDSVYVDLQYDTISLTFTTGSVCLCGVCSHVWSVCEVVLVSCVVGVVVALTVMHVLLFVCEISMMRECEGDGNAGAGAGGVRIWMVHVVQVFCLVRTTC